MVKIDVRNLGIPLLLFLFVFFFCYQIREITRYFLNRPNGMVSLPSPFLLQGCDQDFRSGMEWGRGGGGRVSLCQMESTRQIAMSTFYKYGVIVIF